MSAVTINAEQRLFVIPAGGGYSCAGFDYVFKQLRALSEALTRFGIDVGELRVDEVGSIAQYQQYERACALIGNRDMGTWFDPDTPAKVRYILERYRKSGQALRVFYGDTKTGRGWYEEYDVVGGIGRSTGAMKIPLLVPDGEFGGPGLLDRCIVRMMDVRTRKELYWHPQYHQGEMEIRPATCRAPYTHGVWIDGQNHANFRSYGSAAQWVAFMTGNCMEQPQ